MGANAGCAGNERVSPSPNNHQWWQGEGEDLEGGGTLVGRGEDLVPYISQLFCRYHTSQTTLPTATHQVIWPPLKQLWQSCDQGTHDTLRQWYNHASHWQILLWIRHGSQPTTSFLSIWKTQASAGLDGWTVSRLSVTVSSIPAQPPTALLWLYQSDIKLTVTRLHIPPEWLHQHHLHLADRVKSTASQIVSFHWYHIRLPNVLKWEFLSVSGWSLKFELMSS